MKKLTCRDLGGPCDAMIEGATFMEMGANAQKHVMGLVGEGDPAHQVAVKTMSEKTPEEQSALIADYEQKFNNAPEA
jgi:hypothetical protein